MLDPSISADCVRNSDEDGAEEKCQAYVMEAIATDPLNPEPLQLLASILLSQDRKQVFLHFFLSHDGGCCLLSFGQFDFVFVCH